MIPIHKVFEHFHLNDDPQLPLELLLGSDAFVGKNHKVSWADFACCAFFYKVNAFGWPDDRLMKLCNIVYPEIKKNVEGMLHDTVMPLIALLIDNEFMLIGENDLYDMKTWQQIDKAEFEKRDLFQMSLCFMITAIAIIEAARFLKKEPDYAGDCPFVQRGSDARKADDKKSSA